MNNETNIIPKRAFSRFDSRVTILDGGLIEVHKDRSKTDLAVVTLLTNMNGKHMSASDIAQAFNVKHPSANMKASHVLHSLKMIFKDMPGIVRKDSNGLWFASKQAIAALKKVRYNRASR